MVKRSNDILLSAMVIMPLLSNWLLQVSGSRVDFFTRCLYGLAPIVLIVILYLALTIKDMNRDFWVRSCVVGLLVVIYSVSLLTLFLNQNNLIDHLEIDPLLPTIVLIGSLLGVWLNGLSLGRDRQSAPGDRLNGLR